VTHSTSRNNQTDYIDHSSLLASISTPVHKNYRAGTERTISPENTAAKVRRFMSRMGITRLANITGLDSIGLPVAQAFRPNSRSVSVSQGKGISLDAAKTSALMESVESYHAERINLPLKLGKYADFRDRFTVADVHKLPRTTLSKDYLRRSLPWLEGYDLIQDVPTFVPYETVHTDYTLPYVLGSGSWIASTNGLASGNHMLEAINHAICEVIERDASTLWNVSTVWDKAATRIALETIEDPDCTEVLAKCEHAGIALAVWETTTDVGIPSFLCYMVDQTDHPWRLVRPTEGSGCHPKREIAFLRSVTEAAQARLTMIAGSRDDLSSDEYKSSRNRNALDAVRLFINTGRGRRNFRDVPTWEAETFNDDLHHLLKRLRAVGIRQAVIVDLSKDEFDLAVVRVVVPGMENGTYTNGKGASYVHGARAKSAAAGRP
jgi:YcaO-like protein with predicted kinase domain